MLVHNHSTILKEVIMKPCLVLLLVLFILTFGTNQIAAQDAKEARENLATFNIYFINGYAISYEFYKNDNSVLRFHLDFGGSDNSSDNDGKRINTNSNNDTNTEDITEERKTHNFTLMASPQFLYKFYKSNYGEAYLGAGPFFKYQTSGYENIYQTSRKDINGDDFNSASNSNNKNKSYLLGLSFIIGIKGVLTDRISLFAESHFNAAKKWDEFEQSYHSSQSPSYEYNNSEETEGDGWDYSTTFVRVGVSISL